MPDDQGRPTPEELEAYSATLQQLIDEARALQTAVTDELRRMRRFDRTAVTTVIERRGIERRSVERHLTERPPTEHHATKRRAADRQKAPR
jgi:hypothetical protein